MKGDTCKEKSYLSSSRFTESQLVGKCQNSLCPCPNLSLQPSCLSHKESPCIDSSAQLQGSSAIVTGSLDSTCSRLHGGVDLKSTRLMWLFLLDELPQGIFFFLLSTEICMIRPCNHSVFFWLKLRVWQIAVICSLPTQSLASRVQTEGHSITY